MKVIDKNRIIWHSRRGMLELDLLLEPFARNRFDSLSPQQQQLYQQLLSHEDQDLFSWMMQRQEPSDLTLKPIIELIVAYARTVD